MRDIRFRAKRIDNGRWVEGYYFKTPLTDENSGVASEKGWFFLSDGKTRHCISGWDGVAYVIDPETLGQYTGLEDVNGCEIFEGDLVVFAGRRSDPRVVEWYENGFYLSGMLHSQMDDDSLVVGNVHENPELLR